MKSIEAYVFDYEPKTLQKGKYGLEDMSLIEAQYNDFLVTKRGYLFVLLKVSGINLDLLTTTEQEDVFDEFNAFLMSTLGENSGEVQQYLDITMPVDFRRQNVGEAIIGNSYTKVFFGLDNKGVDDLTKKLRMTFSEKEKKLLESQGNLQLGKYQKYKFLLL